MFLAQSEPHACKITSISFNSDGRQVAIGLDDGSVKVKFFYFIFSSVLFGGLQAVKHE